jgi:signal transduction histidine kinase
MDTRGPLLRRLGNLNPLIVDGVLALCVLAVTLTEIATTARDCGCLSAWDVRWSALFMLIETLPLTLRRRYPFGVMAVVGVAAIAYDVLSIPPEPATAIFAVMLAVYSISAFARRPLAYVAAAIVGLAVVVLNLPGIGDEETFASLTNQFVLLGGAWVVGENTRSRRRQAELLHERAVRTEREQHERERIAALEERGRLAREIHDVIAHSVSVIAVQAGAARAVAEQRPDRAREALGAIEEVSKQTMTELRRALGALRGPGDDTAMHPAPGLDELDDLLEQVRQAGVGVELSTVGERRDLPSGVDLSAYRIVQEALTNAVKHAAPTTARVHISYEPAWLEVVVSDDGPVGDGPPRPDLSSDGSKDGGHGLLGIRERVAILGGTFEAGPSGSGFEVRARLPLETKTEVR